MVEQQQPSGPSFVSSGSLRTKISLKGGYSAPLTPQTCPFYGMKPELPPRAELLGSDDLLAQFDLSGAYKKYCSMEGVSEDLASFLPQVCGSGSLNSRADDSCSLRKLVEDPPRTRNEIRALTASAMAAFKLAPGPVPDSYRLFDSASDSALPSTSAVGATSSARPNNKDYQEFVANYNDPEEVKAKNRKRNRRALDELEDANEKRTKRHRGDEKEKEKKQKKKEKKREKKKKEKVKDDWSKLVSSKPTPQSCVTPIQRASDEEESKRSRERAPSPFY